MPYPEPFQPKGESVMFTFESVFRLSAASLIACSGIPPNPLSPSSLIVEFAPPDFANLAGTVLHEEDPGNELYLSSSANFTMVVEPDSQEEPESLLVSEDIVLPEREEKEEEEGPDVHIRTVDLTRISCDFRFADTESFLNTLRQGGRILYYSSSTEMAEQALCEVISYYCEMPQGIQYLEGRDEQGFYLEILPDQIPSVRLAVNKADAAWACYLQNLQAIDKSLDTGQSDREFVNAVNAYICQNFSYEVNDVSMPTFMTLKRGQCWHYAKLFQDLCLAEGLDAKLIWTDTHAWDLLVIDGITYTFDVTNNDTGNDWTAWSWIA